MWRRLRWGFREKGGKKSIEAKEGQYDLLGSPLPIPPLSFYKIEYEFKVSHQN